MSDQLCSYDHQVTFVDRPYYTVKELFFHLGHVMHPREDAYGRQLPVGSTKHDRNEHLRVEYNEILTNKLIDEIDKQRVFVKNELEIIIESPVEREQLNRARIYKTQIEIFLCASRIKAVFMTPAEMLVKKKVGDKDMLEFTRFDKYLILNDEDIRNKRLSELGSPQSSGEVEQGVQTKQKAQEVLADFKELANAFKVIHNDEDANLEWFSRRCSDVNDYPAFKDARVVAGRRGGSPARFRVLAIAAHLLDRKKIKDRSLRTSIEKHFGDILSEFEDLICPPPS